MLLLNAQPVDMAFYDLGLRHGLWYRNGCSPVKEESKPRNQSSSAFSRTCTDIEPGTGSSDTT
jgi:hypothetical protein